MSVGSGTTGLTNVAVTLASGMTSSASGNWTFAGTSGTQQTITSAGKRLTSGTVTFGTASGASYQLQDNFLTTGNATHSWGTLDLNASTLQCNIFRSNTTNTRVLTANGNIIATSTGASVVLTPTTGLTFNATGSTITLSGTNASMQCGALTLGNVVFSGGGTMSQNTTAAVVTYNNLTVTGTAVKTDSFAFNQGSPPTINSTFQATGQSVTNRLLVTSATAGLMSALTVNAVSGLSNVDFSYITAGGASTPWTGTSMGDVGGNSNITFDTPVTQTWSGTSGGNWSTNAWTTRVPLPQDPVVISSAFSASQTITADMPRLGASINWTGATGSPTWDFSSLPTTICGSTTLISGMSLTGTQTTSFQYKGSSLTLTSAGKTWPQAINITDGTWTAQDDFNTAGVLALGVGFATGVFTATTQNITFLTASQGAFGTVNMGSGNWNITSTAAGTIWGTPGTFTTVNAGTSNIVIVNASTNSRTFAGGGKTYYNLSETGSGSTGTVVITGSNTFNDIFFSDASNSRTVSFTSGTTTTFTATHALTGVFGFSGNLIAVNAVTGGSPATFAFPNGYGGGSDFVSVKDITATTNTWYAGANSTNVSGNTNVTFTAPPVVVAKGGNLLLLGVG